LLPFSPSLMPSRDISHTHSLSPPSPSSSAFSWQLLCFRVLPFHKISLASAPVEIALSQFLGCFFVATSRCLPNFLNASLRFLFPPIPSFNLVAPRTASLHTKAIASAPSRKMSKILRGGSLQTRQTFQIPDIECISFFTASQHSH